MAVKLEDIAEIHGKTLDYLVTTALKAYREAALRDSAGCPELHDSAPLRAMLRAAATAATAVTVGRIAACDLPPIPNIMLGDLACALDLDAVLTDDPEAEDRR